MAYPGSPVVLRAYFHYAAAEAVAVTLATLLPHRRDIHTESLVFANTPANGMSANRFWRPIYWN
jgi:hypothetical protein